MCKRRALAVALAVISAVALPGAVGVHGKARAAATTTATLYDNGVDGLYQSAGRDSQDYSFPNDSSDSRAADDFVVPKRKAWTISQVEVIGFTGTSPTTLRLRGPVDFNVTVFRGDGAGGLPGTAAATTKASYTIGPSNSGSNSNKYTFTLDSPIQLPAGTYWVSVRAVADLLTSGYWGWLQTAPHSPTGSPGVWQKATGPCTSWCVQQHDFTFRLSGTSTAA